MCAVHPDLLLLLLLLLCGLGLVVGDHKHNHSTAATHGLANVAAI